MFALPRSRPIERNHRMGCPRHRFAETASQSHHIDSARRHSCPQNRLCRLWRRKEGDSQDNHGGSRSRSAMQSCQHIGWREGILVCGFRGGAEYSVPKERVQALAVFSGSIDRSRALNGLETAFRMSGLEIPGVRIFWFSLCFSYYCASKCTHLIDHIIRIWKGCKVGVNVFELRKRGMEIN